MKCKSIPVILASLMIHGSVIIATWYSQSSLLNVDSLNIELSKKSGARRISDLLALSESFRISNPQKALEYAQEAKELAIQADLTEAEADCTFLIGQSLSNMGKRAEGSIQILEAVKYYKATNKINQLTQCWKRLADNSSLLGDYDHSMQYRKKLIKIFEGLDNNYKIAQITRDIGATYYMHGDYNNALRSVNKAIALFEIYGSTVDLAQTNLTKATVLGILGRTVEALDLAIATTVVFEEEEQERELAVANHHIGFILQNNNLYEAALDYYHRSLEFYEKSGYTDYTSALLLNFGQVALELDQFEKAEIYFNRALAIDKEKGRESRPDLYACFSQLYTETGKYELALSYATKSMRIYEKEEDRNGIIQTQIDKANAHIGLQQLDQAENLLIQAANQLDTLDIPKNSLVLNESFISLYEKKNDYKKIAFHHEQANRINTSLFSAQQIEGINNILIRAKTREEEKKTAFWKDIALNNESERTNLESNQNKLQNKYYLMMLGLLATGALFFFGRIRMKKRQNDIQAELLKSQQEQTTLKDQLSKSKEEVNQLSVNLVRKNQALKDLKSSLNQIANTPKEKKTVDDLIRRLQLDEMLQTDWNYFQSLFTERFPDFFKTLKKDHPVLSQKDLRLCGLIRSSISPQEASDILGISLESVHSARYRLRKKLNLDKSTDLDQFLKEV